MNFIRKQFYIFVVSLAVIYTILMSAYIYEHKPKTIQEAGPGAQKMYCESQCTPSFSQCISQCRNDLQKARSP